MTQHHVSEELECVVYVSEWGFCTYRMSSFYDREKGRYLFLAKVIVYTPLYGIVI